jgi:hypothetical protein
MRARDVRSDEAMAYRSVPGGRGKRESGELLGDVFDRRPRGELAAGDCPRIMKRSLQAFDPRSLAGGDRRQPLASHVEASAANVSFQ